LYQKAFNSSGNNNNLTYIRMYLCCILWGSCAVAAAALDLHFKCMTLHVAVAVAVDVAVAAVAPLLCGTLPFNETMPQTAHDGISSCCCCTVGLAANGNSNSNSNCSNNYSNMLKDMSVVADVAVAARIIIANAKNSATARLMHNLNGSA